MKLGFMVEGDNMAVLLIKSIFIDKWKNKCHCLFEHTILFKKKEKYNIKRFYVKTKT